MVFESASQESKHVKPRSGRGEVPQLSATSLIMHQGTRDHFRLSYCSTFHFSYCVTLPQFSHNKTPLIFHITSHLTFHNKSTHVSHAISRLTSHTQKFPLSQYPYRPPNLSMLSYAQPVTPYTVLRGLDLSFDAILHHKILRPNVLQSRVLSSI